MQISKLYVLISDILIEEEKIKFDAKLQAIINAINTLSSNQNNPTVQKQLDDNLATLKKLLATSFLNDLTPSYQKIMDEINGSKYFGNQISDTIDQIINASGFNISVISQNLNKLKTERVKFIQLLKTLENTFEELDVEVHYIDDESIYEIGYILPENVTNNHAIPAVTKQLNKWNQFIKTINEITDQGSEDCKIAIQDSGTLQFFFENPEVTATVVITAIERLAALYKKILEIRKLRMELKKFSFPKNEQKAIEKHESKTADDEIKQIVDDVFKEYGKKRFEGSRRNELKNGLTLHLKWLAKQLDSGVKVEVNTPYLPEVVQKSDETEANYKKRVTKFNEQKAKFDLVTSKVSLIKTFADTTKEVFKYLKEPNGDE